MPTLDDVISHSQDGFSSLIVTDKEPTEISIAFVYLRL